MTWAKVEEHLEDSIAHCEENGRCADSGGSCELHFESRELPYEPYEENFVVCERCGIEVCIDEEIDQPE